MDSGRYLQRDVSGMAIMRFKQGVRIIGLRPELLAGLLVCESVYNKHDIPFLITSVTDSTHSRGSLHYVGFAADLTSVPDKIVNELKKELGGDWDVVNEKTHVHIEFQPKTPLNK